MLAWMVLGFTFLFAVMLAGRWLLNAEPRDVARALSRLALFLLLGVFGFLLVTGRLTWALMALFGFLPWFLRMRMAWRGVKNAARAAAGPGRATGQTSTVETHTLRMTLDHDSGAMDGEIIAGPFAGRRIDDLSDVELETLMAACRRDDPESLRLLEAWMERARPDWRGDEETGEQESFSGAMSRDEALRILGLEADADTRAIKEAHRRLMSGLHPDHGGSSYLAAKINQAKDVLLGS